MLTTAVVKRSSFDPDMSFTLEGLEDLCHAFSLFFFRAYHDLARPIWRISWQLEHPECKAEKVFQGPESATENFLWLESCHEKSHIFLLKNFHSLNLIFHMDRLQLAIGKDEVLLRIFVQSLMLCRHYRK